MLLLTACQNAELAGTTGSTDGAASSTTATASTGADTGAEFVVGGQIKGDLPNTPVKVLVLWMIELPMGGGDGIYKFGDGTVDGASYSATLRGPLPAAATIIGGLGVGILVLVPLDLEVPDGIVDEDIESHLLGIAGNNSIIWRSDRAAPVLPWSWAEAFPSGYSCGHCLRSMDLMGWDDFTPGACDDLTLYVPLETTMWCEWT